MIQLTFQPAFDSFHTIFRLLRLREVTQKLSLPIDHIRILDFFLAFPFRISAIRLTPQHRRFAKLSKTYAQYKPYGEQPSDRDIFVRMELVQIVALRSIASEGMLDNTQLGEARIVQWTSKLTPEDLSARIVELNESESDLLEFLRLLATEYSLTGQNGLKGRTGLMDYRYDPI